MQKTKTERRPQTERTTLVSNQRLDEDLKEKANLKHKKDWMEAKCHSIDGAVIQISLLNIDAAKIL